MHYRDAVAGRERKWERERRRLALDVETSPLDSRFSGELQALLAREDQEPALAPRVDAMLAVETKLYFETVCRRNLDKWQAVATRQAHEQQALARDMGAVDRSDEQDHESHEENDDDYEQRLRARAHANWATDQAFSLAKAFDLQLERVDAEWSAHQQSLETQQDPRWHHKEKQSRLAQTAPVFEPDTRNALLDLQKRNAKKWINRQALRMKAQLDATKHFHSYVARAEDERHKLSKCLREQASRLDARPGACFVPLVSAESANNQTPSNRRPKTSYAHVARSNNGNGLVIPAVVTKRQVLTHPATSLRVRHAPRSAGGALSKSDVAVRRSMTSGNGSSSNPRAATPSGNTLLCVPSSAGSSSLSPWRRSLNRPAPVVVP